MCACTPTRESSARAKGRMRSEGSVPLIQSFRRLLIGQDPLNIEAAFERMRTAGIFAGAQAGQYVAALTAVEIALWDIAGKALGLPVWQLLGGKVRDKRARILRFGRAGNVPGRPALIARIHEIQDMGFTAAKIDIDESDDPARFDRVNWTASNGEIDHMVGKVQFTRESYPKTDRPGGGYARPLRRRPPASGWPRKWSRSICCGWKSRCRRRTSTPCATSANRRTRPICCGENIYLRHGFRELLEKRAADIIMPDLQKVGGLLEGRKIADMAHAYYVPFAPHCVVSPIGTMATAQVCAVVPNFLVLEWHWIDSPGSVEGLGEGRGDHREGLHHAAGARRHRGGDERGGSAARRRFRARPGSSRGKERKPWCTFCWRLAIAWLFIRRAPRWGFRCERTWRRGDMWEPVGFPPEPMEQRREPPKAEGTAARRIGAGGRRKKGFPGRPALRADSQPAARYRPAQESVAIWRCCPGG